MILEKIWIYVGFFLCYVCFWVVFLITSTFHENPLYMIFSMGWILILCTLFRFVYGFEYLRPDRLIISTVVLFVLYSIAPIIYTIHANGSLHSINLTSQSQTIDTSNDTSNNQAIVSESTTNEQKYVHDALLHSRDSLIVGSMSNTHVHIHVNSGDLHSMYNQIFPYILSFETKYDYAFTIILLIFEILAVLYLIYNNAGFFKAKTCREAQISLFVTKHKNKKRESSKGSSKSHTDLVGNIFSVFSHKKTADESHNCHKESIENLFLKPTDDVKTITKHKKKIRALSLNAELFCRFVDSIRVMIWHESLNTALESHFEDEIQSEYNTDLLPDNLIKNIHQELENVFSHSSFILFSTEVTHVTSVDSVKHKYVYQKNGFYLSSKTTLKDVVSYLGNQINPQPEDRSDLAFLSLHCSKQSKEKNTNQYSFVNAELNDTKDLLDSKKCVLSLYQKHLSSKIPLQVLNDDIHNTKLHQLNEKTISEISSRLKSSKNTIKQYTKNSNIQTVLLWIYIIVMFTIVFGLSFFTMPTYNILARDLTYDFIWQSLIIRIHLVFLTWLVTSFFLILCNHKLCTNIVLDYSYTKYKLLLIGTIQQFLKHKFAYNLRQKINQQQRQQKKHEKTANILQVLCNCIINITNNFYKTILKEDLHQFNDGSMDYLIRSKLLTFFILTPIFFSPLLFKSLYLAFTVTGIFVLIISVLCIIQFTTITTKLNYKENQLLLGFSEEYINSQIYTMLDNTFRNDDQKHRKKAKKKNTLENHKEAEDDDSDSE